MRIAVFSDIHGNLQALNAILDDIKKENFDEVICLGDVIGLGPKPKECLELLLNSNVTILAGNHDLYYRDGIEIDDEITNIDEIAHHRWVHRTIKDYVDAVTTARQNNSDLITEYQGKQDVATNELSLERDNLVKEQNAKKECASITKVVSIWVEDAHEG